MALSSYDMDFEKMVKQLLGTIVRKTKRVAWLTACLKALRNIHDEFVTFVTNKKYEVKWNGQTIKLEQRLIDKFGAGIYITNHVLETNGAFVGEGNDTQFFIGENDDNSQFVDVTYAISGPNFTVNVPIAIVFTLAEMQAIINTYKLLGTTYNIVIV